MSFTLADALLVIETEMMQLIRKAPSRFTLADALLGIETIAKLVTKILCFSFHFG